MKEARKLPYNWRPYDKKYTSYPICRELVLLDLFECQLVDEFRIDCILIWVWVAHQSLVVEMPHCLDQMPSTFTAIS